MDRSEPQGDYSIYDERYAELRVAGKSGWVDVQSPNWSIHLGALRRALAAEYCPSSGPALDLGCGAGCWSLVLADQGFQVTGVDLSPRAIAWAREKATDGDERGPGTDRPGTVEFHCTSATDLSRAYLHAPMHSSGT